MGMWSSTTKKSFFCGSRHWQGNHGGQQQPLKDGFIAPLIKLDNHWKPKKNVSALVVAKKVELILSKMAKEKFIDCQNKCSKSLSLSLATTTVMQCSGDSGKVGDNATVISTVCYNSWHPLKSVAQCQYNSGIPMFDVTAAAAWRSNLWQGNISDFNSINQHRLIGCCPHCATAGDPLLMPQSTLTALEQTATLFLTASSLIVFHSQRSNSLACQCHCMLIVLIFCNVATATQVDCPLHQQSAISASD